GADLAGLPAGHRDVAAFEAAEDLLDVLFGVKFGLVSQVEDPHWRAPCIADRDGVRRECGKPRAKAKGLLITVNRRVALDCCSSMIFSGKRRPFRIEVRGQAFSGSCF